jgi:hypothetical protein
VTSGDLAVQFADQFILRVCISADSRWTAGLDGIKLTNHLHLE